MASSVDRPRLGTALALLAAAAGAAAAPEQVQPEAAVSLPGAWLTAADLLPAAARQHAALASLRLSALPGCGELSLPWPQLAKALQRAFPGRYELPPSGVSRVRQQGQTLAPHAFAALAREALARACGGDGHCELEGLPALAATCLPQGAASMQAQVALPRGDDARGSARLQLRVDGAVQATGPAAVRWRPQPAWRLREPLAAGQALLQSALEPAWQAPAGMPAPVRYDKAGGVLRASADLPAGSVLPSASADFAAAARGGEPVQAVAQAGTVRVWRRAELAADAAPGRAAWARLPDGRWLPLQPTQAGAAAGWEVLP